MALEAWADLWVFLLWGSEAAFALVTLYIVIGAIRGIFAKAEDEGEAKGRRDG